MYLGVQFLSVPRNWGSWSAPGLWSSRTDTGLRHRKPGYGNWENTSHFWSLQSTTVEIFFFISWQRRVTGCMAALPQLYKVSTSKPPPYQTQKQAYSSCRRLLAALQQQQLQSHSMAKRKFWSLCNSLPFSSLNWATYLFQGTGTANFNKAKKSVYYQAIEPL